MALVLLAGGARSGKSRLAVTLASRQPAPVTFLATAEADDAEMARRIDLHRAERPAAWRTVEEPLELARAIAAVDAGCLVIDCLSLWVANVMAAGADEPAVEAEARAAATVAAGRTGLTVAVTNEVGMGIVPDTRVGRDYRDVLGRANAAWADAAACALLVVAGRALVLARAEEVLAGLGV